MKKLIKKFLNPSGPLEFYSGVLPEAIVQAPLTHIGADTPGVYQVESDLKRKDGRGRIYRGTSNGKDIYYLTSKDSDKIIGYTTNLPKEGELWSWEGYQRFLDDYTAPQPTKSKEGTYDRTHTERRKEMKRLDRKNPMYRGLTLNGNTDQSYAGTLKNNENQAALGQGLQTALNAAAAAMFMGGPSAADNLFDVSDAINNAAAGNWGMAGLSLGSALLPGISYGAYRVNNALNGISAQNIAEAMVDGMTDVYRAAPTQVTGVRYQPFDWYNLVQTGTQQHTAGSDVDIDDYEDMAFDGNLTPTDDYMNNLNELDDYLVRARHSNSLSAPTPSSTPVNIFGKTYNLQGLSLDDINVLLSLNDSGRDAHIVLRNLTDLPGVMRLLELPDLGDAVANAGLLSDYLRPNSRTAFHWVNSGDPMISQAFLNLGYLPLSPDLYDAYIDYLLTGDWNPAFNQALASAVRSGTYVPYTDLVDLINLNSDYGVPSNFLHLNLEGDYDGSYPVKYFRGIKAATPEIAAQYGLRAPSGNRTKAVERNMILRHQGLPSEPVEIFTDDVLAGTDVSKLLQYGFSYEPNLTMGGVSSISSAADVTPEAIATFLGNNTPMRSTKYQFFTDADMEDALSTSGNVIGHSSLSVDSYPLKMRRIGRGVRNGMLVPYINPSSMSSVVVNGVPYVSSNYYGLNNRIEASPELLANAQVPVLDADGNPVKTEFKRTRKVVTDDGKIKLVKMDPKVVSQYRSNLTDVDSFVDLLGGVRRVHYAKPLGVTPPNATFKLKKLKNGKYTAYYVLPDGSIVDGNYMGYADILTDLQTVDLMNLQILRSFPADLQPPPVILKEGRIYYPDQKFLVREQGGKLIPKSKKFV